MAKTVVGALTVQQRDALLQNLVDRLGSKPPNPPMMQGQQLVHHYVKNISGETAPAYACMQVVGTEEIGGQNYLQVDKPADATGRAGWYIFNSFQEIANQELGIAYDGPCVRVLSNASGLSAGDKLSPTPSSWYLQEGTLFILAGQDDIRTDVVKIFVQGGESACDFVLGTIIDQGEDYDGKYLHVTPTYAPCGCSTIPGLNEYGYIEVRDKCGLILPDDIDYTGDKAFAKYMQPIGETYSECEWVLVQVCCGVEMVNVGTCLSLGSSTEDPYSDENCLILDRVKMPLPCPQPTTDCEICGPEPCPEVDCDLYPEYPTPYAENPTPYP